MDRPQQLKSIDLRPADLAPVIRELKGFKYLGDVSSRLQRVDPGQG
ncbi:MAG: hypothetical protein M5U25_07355 [Planctomycetota bacterium]|nr:hypothetical protein [Planctomycetota bacterium]